MPKGCTILESCSLDLYTVRFRSGRTHAVICGLSAVMHVQNTKQARNPQSRTVLGAGAPNLRADRSNVGLAVQIGTPSPPNALIIRQLSRIIAVPPASADPVSFSSTLHKSEQPTASSLASLALDVDRASSVPQKQLRKDPIVECTALILQPIGEMLRLLTPTMSKKYGFCSLAADPGRLISGPRVRVPEFFVGAGRRPLGDPPASAKGGRRSCISYIA